MSEEYLGMHSLVFQNECIRVRVIPELGCKIVEIYDLENGHEWLWSDKSRPIKPANYGDPYDLYDISGFDECFPNIGISQDPKNTQVTLPDHGEIWSLPWTVTEEEYGLSASVVGKLYDYHFSRKLSLRNRKLLIEYSVRNVGDTAITYMWSAHPLFVIDEGMKIEITGNPKMSKEFGYGGRIGADGDNWYGGHLTEHVWPKVLGADGRISDMSEVSLDKVLTDKVVLDAPDDGLVTLKKLSSGRSLTMKFSPLEIPFLGICYNFGAWPLTGEPATWVALEPTTGKTDRLDECAELDCARELAPKSSSTWSLEIELN
jgi:galactose mutarotase-like enzyme